MTRNFKGPLFIVGLSRSGTKLIRDLLNQNKNISIPRYESHFIPNILSDYNESDVQSGYRKIIKSAFASKLPSAKVPTFSELNHIVPIINNAKLVEAFLKYYGSDDFKGGWDENMIWGDKTPSNLRHLDLLINKFPSCKIIHIVRDPRDRAISVSRTWGKSMYRGTELWRREVQEAIKWRDKSDLYMELKYEDLVMEPEKILRRICIFLEVSFTEKMLTLESPSERHGVNSNAVLVGKNSLAKFTKEDVKKIQRIEEIAYPMMRKMKYNVKFASSHKKFPVFKMFLLKYSDFVKYKFNNVVKGY